MLLNHACGEFCFALFLSASSSWEVLLKRRRPVAQACGAAQILEGRLTGKEVWNKQSGPKRPVWALWGSGA